MPLMIGAARLATDPDPRSLEQLRLDLCEQVNLQRDERILSGFTMDVDGVTYTFQTGRDLDRENITGMSKIAQDKIAAGGVSAGDLRWYNPDVDFEWITADNSLAPMDAFQVAALFGRAADVRSVLTFVARAYKDAILAAPDAETAQAIYDSIVWST